MPREYNRSIRRLGDARDQQRAEWKRQGLTMRGTPRKKRRSEMTPHELAAHRMVQGKKAAKAIEQQNAADRADAARREQAAHDNDPRTIAYREAKAQSVARQQRVMAEAKQEFERQLAAAADAQKGGRPKSKGLASSVRGRQKHDPDALVLALRPLREMGW